MEAKTILSSIVSVLVLISIGISICFCLGKKPPDNHHLFANPSRAADGGVAVAPPVAQPPL